VSTSEWSIEVGGEGGFVIKPGDPGYVWVEFVNARGEQELAIMLNREEAGRLALALKTVSVEERPALNLEVTVGDVFIEDATVQVGLGDEPDCLNVYVVPPGDGEEVALAFTVPLGTVVEGAVRGPQAKELLTKLERGRT
jgi:hypothetical protein